MSASASPSPAPLRILALYLGEPEKIAGSGKPGGTRSGIHKRPVDTAWLDAGGLRGDHVLNRKYHGGPDQAAYLYTQPDALAWTERGLPADLGRSYFGENLRLDGLSSAEVRPGDRLGRRSDSGSHCPAPAMCRGRRLPAGRV
nr:MOSC domain-containing protein [Deinococcus sp. Marseille-Q6407]